VGISKIKFSYAFLPTQSFVRGYENVGNKIQTKKKGDLLKSCILYENSNSIENKNRINRINRINNVYK